MTDETPLLPGAEFGPPVLVARDASSADVDSAGTPFDAAVHQRKFTRDGKWAPKGGRRPWKHLRGQAEKTESFDPLTQALADPDTLPPEPAKDDTQGAQEGAGKAPEQQPTAAQSKGTAITVTALCERLTIALLGPDMATTQAEKDELVDAWARYIESKGGANLTPGWALLAGYTGIIASRFDKAAVQQRAMSLYQRVRSWFSPG